jgi:hypothetical protein
MVSVLGVIDSFIELDTIKTTSAKMAGRRNLIVHRTRFSASNFLFGSDGINALLQPSVV